MGNDLLPEGKLALVPVVGDAYNSKDFFNLVNDELATLGLQLVSLDDVELLSIRKRNHELPAALETAIAEITKSNRVAYGSFHTFPEVGQTGDQATRE